MHLNRGHCSFRVVSQVYFWLPEHVISPIHWCELNWKLGVRRAGEGHKQIWHADADCGAAQGSGRRGRDQRSSAVRAAHRPRVGRALHRLTSIHPSQRGAHQTAAGDRGDHFHQGCFPPSPLVFKSPCGLKCISGVVESPPLLCDKSALCCLFSLCVFGACGLSYSMESFAISRFRYFIKSCCNAKWRRFCLYLRKTEANFCKAKPHIVSCSIE